MAQPIKDPTDSAIIFNDNPKITLVEETVVYDIKDENLYNVNVKVNYKLKNLEKSSKNIEVMFVAEALEYSNIQLKQNGKSIKPIKINNSSEFPKNWNTDINENIIEPISGKALEKICSGFENKPNIDFIKFPITFKENEEIHLEVLYVSKGGFYKRNFINTIYVQQYYLTPAKFWNGEAKVRLLINFPKNKDFKLHSNIPMEQKNNMYIAELSKIPDNEWVFSYVNKNNLLFNTNYRKAHNTYVLIISFMLVVLGIIIHKKINKYISLIIYMLVLLFLIKYISLSYGFYFILFILGRTIIFPFILIMISISLYKYFVRKNKGGL